MLASRIRSHGGSCPGSASVSNRQYGIQKAQMASCKTSREVDQVLQKLKDTGEYEQIMNLMVEHPGAQLYVVAVPDHRLKVTVEYSVPNANWQALAVRRCEEFLVDYQESPGLVAFAVHLLFCVAAGMAIGSFFGWLGAALFGFPGTPVLRGVFRGALIGIIACVAHWCDQGWWGDLGIRQKRVAVVLTAIAVLCMMYVAWVCLDIWGTIAIVGVTVIYLLRRIQRHS